MSDITDAPQQTKLRVLSCVPEQRTTFESKLAWIDEQAMKHRPDLFVTPQEYFGGIQQHFFETNEPVSYTAQELLEPIERLARKHNMGIATGGLIDDPELGERRERIYVVDPIEGMTGFADKVTLPAYDHVDAKGRTRVYPEYNIENRAKAFWVKGARVSILFCWEAYSSYIWHAISRAQPDMVLSMIKFGVRGWPQKAKDEATKESIVTGFGFGDDGGWMERLHMAAKWDVACPIICATNSWRLPKKAGALAGVILPWEEKENAERPARKHTLWVSEGKGVIDEHVQVDEIDYLYWRYIRDHKFTLKNASGEWPSSEARNLTMYWKIRRMERKAVGLPKLQAEAERPGRPGVKWVAPKDEAAAPAGLLY